MQNICSAIEGVTNAPFFLVVVVTLIVLVTWCATQGRQTHGAVKNTRYHSSGVHSCILQQLYLASKEKQLQETCPVSLLIFCWCYYEGVLTKVILVQYHFFTYI